jgi:hypothetical protein
MSSFLSFTIEERPLSRARKDLKKLKIKLQDLNSQYPETRRFLYRKGLTHVSQLDQEGRKELREYLEGVYKGSLH